MRARLAAAVAPAITALLVGSTAGAHSTLVSSCPGETDVVNQLDRIELTFGSDIVDDGQALVALAGDEGRTDIEIGPATFVDERTLAATVPPALEPGRYIIRYMVTSIDGDLSDGGFEFTFDPDAAQDAPGCGEVDGDGGGATGWVLLGVGVVAVTGIGLLLRPRRSTA